MRTLVVLTNILLIILYMVKSQIVQSQFTGTLDDLIMSYPLPNNGQNVNGGSEDCQCVKYYQCDTNANIVVDGEGLIDLRIDEACKSPEICCKRRNIKINNPPKILEKPERNGCGKRHPDGVGFKLKNKVNEAEFSEFPWMVAIMTSRIGNNHRSRNIYKCGGSLIHSRAVLTGAHCVYQSRPDELLIRAGEWNTQTDTEPLPHQDRNVTKIIIHHEFNHRNLFNDFAILVLDHPVDNAYNVDNICLPQDNEIFDYSRCISTGWGKDHIGQSYRFNVILKRVELPVINRRTCVNRLRTTRLGRYFELHDSFICAGGEQGIDTCRGDGGGPLVCPMKSNPTRYVQAGIVAWGIGCGESGIPGVYASVAYAREWINTQFYENELFL